MPLSSRGSKASTSAFRLKVLRAGSRPAKRVADTAHSFDCFLKVGQTRPGSGIGLLGSPTGSSLPES
jgi:hypothetical protein